MLPRKTDIKRQGTRCVVGSEADWVNIFAVEPRTDFIPDFAKCPFGLLDAHAKRGSARQVPTGREREHLSASAMPRAGVTGGRGLRMSKVVPSLL